MPSEPVWSYRCIGGRCKKTAIDHSKSDTVSKAISLQVCRLLCDGSSYGTVWPRPTGDARIGTDLVHLDLDGMIFDWVVEHDLLRDRWDASVQRFRGQLKNKAVEETIRSGGNRLKVVVEVGSDSLVLNHQTDESYKLMIKGPQEHAIAVSIKAATYFGARHGLETLAQLIVFDDIRNELLVLTDVLLQDGPKYPHRGLSLDTSRNYVDIASLKRTIDTLAMVKMNVLHWHVTDSHSFPLVIESQPLLSKFGAYNKKQIYTAV
ncbi:chitooligosaccharidolytic beta-N-acetylglucosaminidase-like [Uranotaenia lowii]|uniref:chitooligosaccharidolytic beta-N-acetylglucosaminidase-like n=1 Tax=Uranotaenia lowii TaxID=190385 RepID=UPI002479CDE1|nr:chitooligosaccharidolytic beta-N-acetylglucosaminidase-like [Uranotaenia lowii]